ncbi:MAG TPA: hypothetical protein VHA75_01130, partial [Rugosimonospora sp.]|nr:hypothetical protein [Rugosimonospora sp.]
MSEPLPLDLHIPTRPAADGPMPTVPGLLVARLVIRGRPAPQGSKHFLGLSPNGKQRFTEDSAKVGSWRADVQAAAGAFIEARERETGRRGVAIDAPIALSCVFYFPRPISH